MEGKGTASMKQLLFTRAHAKFSPPGRSVHASNLVLEKAEVLRSLPSEPEATRLMCVSRNPHAVSLTPQELSFRRG